MKFYDCQTAPSPRRVRMFIAEKEIEIPTVQIDLRNEEQLTEAFRKINPRCTVPVLELDDDTCLNDTLAICHYLESQFPEPNLMGRDGREFEMIKFRTMRTDAEQQSGPVWTTEADPRVTSIGSILRRYSLDEFPQLWNVLRGDMSLVGPRPERRVFVEEFSRTMPRYFERHRVQSGLTGWAQVHGLRGNTSIEDRTLYDLHYVENWSLGLDIRILLMTIHHVLRGENAY